MYFSELNLSESLQKAVAALGFKEMTPIQAQAIPPGLAGRDIIGCAQTGTGKTAAFLLPALQHLLQDQRKTKNPRVVVLAPTRELVIQMTGQARQLAAHTPLRIAAIYGGAKMGSQIDKLRRGVDVVIATRAIPFTKVRSIMTEHDPKTTITPVEATLLKVKPSVKEMSLPSKRWNRPSLPPF